MQAQNSIGLLVDRREGLWAYPFRARNDQTCDPVRGGLFLLIEGQVLMARDSERDFERLEKRLALRQVARCVVVSATDLF